MDAMSAMDAMETINAMDPMASDAYLTQGLIHASYILAALAFLVREILWLRLLSIVANLCIGVVAYVAMPEPRWAIVGWTSVFVMINLAHSAWLIYERHLATMSEDEQALYQKSFQALDRVSVKKLLRCGTWTELAPNQRLARQGVHLDRLFLLAAGEAAVLLGGRIVTRLKPGAFVGEIAYLSGDTATATVVVTEPVRCIAWQADRLRQLLARQPELRNVFHGAIGGDLAAKIAAHNVTLSQV